MARGCDVNARVANKLTCYNKHEIKKDSIMQLILFFLERSPLIVRVKRGFVPFQVFLCSF